MPPRKTRRNTKKKSTRKAAAKSLTPLQKKEVKILTAPQVETKYNAALIVKNGIVTPLISSVVTGINAGGLQPLLMPIAQGIQNNQRVGLRIHPTHCRVTCRVWLAQSQQDKFPTSDVTVKVWFLSSKRVKAYDQRASLPATALLDNGDQTTVDWASATPYDQFYSDYLRVATDEFTTHSVNHYRLMKNLGATNADLGALCPNIASPSTPMVKFSQVIALPASLQYENSGVFTSNQPSNAMPLMGIVAYNTDGTVYRPVDSANSVLCDVFTELFYKDA